MSLDGFIAQLNDEAGRLHDWIFAGTTERSATSPRDSASGSNRAVIDELFNTTGAVVMGRRTFDSGEEPWGDEPPFQMPCFVVSHRFREEVAKGATTFTFVTDGIESAVARAKAAAGDKKVAVMGANIAQQCIRAGLLDELEIHLVPILFGEGIPLFEHFDTGQIELERTRVLESAGVTHLRFRVVK
jgi:dihydrofolate reductase